MSMSRFGLKTVNASGLLLRRLGFPGRLLAVRPLMDAARTATGLEDFGGEEFIEPLERLLAACEKEARMNTVGRMVVRYDVLRSLINRLHLTDDRHHHPEITSERIVAPIFIISLPRTGTTLLHALLAADGDNRVPLTWETMYPSARARPGMSAARRITRAAADLRWMERLAPGFAALHPLEANLPQECLVMMALSFQSYQYQTMYDIPSYVAWLKAEPLDHGYRMHRRFLQHLQWRRRGRRWVLKAPAHMASMDALLRTYPDARFVQIHRDPTEVLASDASLTAALFAAFSDHVDPHTVGRETLERLSDWLERFMAARRTLPARRICDLSYRDLVADPQRTVEYLYRYFDLDLSDAARTHMQGVLASHPRYKHGRHRYTPADFGLEDSCRHPGLQAYSRAFDL